VSDENVLKELPHTLAVDVLIHINKDILQKVEFFKNANDIFIREVVDMLTMETYLPEDYIIRQGEYGDCMYFLSIGTAEVVVNGNSVAKLGSGSPFGEMALVSGDKRMASIRALDYCDVYRLHREGFERLRSRYAEFDQRVKDVIAQREQANRNKS
jgi:voltage-gated potassium channel